MNSKAARFALRETRAFVRSPRTGGTILAAGLVLGIAGPFGTIDEMLLVPRLVYWLVLVATTLATGGFVHAWLSVLLRGRWPAAWVRIVLSGGITGIVVTAEVLMLNWAVLGVSPQEPDYLIFLAANVLAISLIVSGASSYLMPVTGAQDNATKPAPAARLIARLPLKKRGAVISLSAQDHFVIVSTSKGASLVLIRLSDPIAEVQGTAGLQVHRSHWVALDPVSSARRVGDKAVLAMRDGCEIPVSRTYLKTVREAGLLAG